MESQQLPSLGTAIQVFFIMGFVGLIYESVAYSTGCDKDGPAKRFTIDAVRAPKSSYFRYKGSINPLALIPGSVSNALIYGTGTVALLALNHYLPSAVPVWARVIIFGLCASALELAVGLVVNRDHTNWDYRGNFANIAGQTDAQHFVLWGLAGSFFVFVLYPRMIPAMEKVNILGRKHMYILCALLIGAVLITISAERTYEEGNRPWAIKLFDWMEPSWPKARVRCYSN
jgi:hypothetical protein